MSVITFDTIEYFDELINAGVPEQQAKAQSKALKRVVDEVVGGELVTKADLKEMELKIEQRFSKFDARFVRLEVLMALMLAVLLIPTLKSLFV